MHSHAHVRINTINVTCTLPASERFVVGKNSILSLNGHGSGR